MKVKWIILLVAVLLLLWFFVDLPSFFGLDVIGLWLENLTESLVMGAVIWWIIIGIVLIGILVGSLLAIYYWLAPRDIFFTFVSEGTAKVVMKMGSFHDVKMVWRGHRVDCKYNIYRKGHEEAKGKEAQEIKGEISGGLYFIGVYPFFQTHQETIRWSKNHGRDEGEFGDKEILNYTNLKPEVYRSIVKGAETKEPERFQVQLEYLVTMKVSNVYKYWFISPENSLDKALAQLDTVMRDFVAKVSFDELYVLDRKELWERIKEEKLIEKTLPKWGVLIANEGIGIKNVSPEDEGITEALAAEQKEEHQARARAREIAGTAMHMLGASNKKEIEAFIEQMKEDPTLKEDYREAVKLVKYKLGMDSGSYLNIDVEGGGDLENSLLKMIGGFFRIPQGKEEDSYRKNDNDKSDNKGDDKTDDKTDEKNKSKGLLE